MTKTAAVPAILILLPLFAHAKARFAPKGEMIAEADVIAVVTITDVKSLEPEKRVGDQLATAVVKQVIKGEIKNEQEIEFFVSSFFPCAVTQVSKGAYLVFLAKDGKMLKGKNWHLSYRPIENGSLDWYKDDTSYALEKKPLEKVVAEVHAIVKDPKPGKQGAAR
jgi:hypothetical protein